MAANPTDAIIYNTEGGVATVTLNRPERRNAIDSATRVLLTEAFATADADPDVRIVVLTGTGSSFCAGVDLKEPAIAQNEQRHVLLDKRAPLAAPVAESLKPVLAAVNGPAVGGGFELALAADIRIAANTASFALPEGLIGSIPGSGGTQRLFSALPSSIAWEILLTGDPLPAEAAARYGLVSDICEPHSLAEEADNLAGRIARLAPLSLRAIKLAGRAALEGTAGMQLERTLWTFLSTTEDREEGRAAFREKRDPRYKGR